MKGLLIAYTFAPEKTVGALRPSYWAEEISNCSEHTLDVVTATAADKTDDRYRRIVVPNEGSSPWSFVIKDEGLTWKKSLLNYFKANDPSHYDFVILTGGPFFHFSLGKFLKQKGLNVIVDFRDPFSVNPRFNDGVFKRLVKQYVEKNALKSADLVLTVNEECHALIAPTMQLKRAVLPNGFDERATSNIDKVEVIYDFFYGGKYYWEPTLFFDAVQSSGSILAHAGNRQDYTHPLMKSENNIELGLLQQSVMYAELAKAEIGVVFTIDVPFESTTKIYDYLALNKKLLIITQGEPHRGALNRELVEYPMYRWVKNEPESIATAIAELKEMSNVEFDATSYSRKAGLLKLIAEIEQLT